MSSRSTCRCSSGSSRSLLPVAFDPRPGVAALLPVAVDPALARALALPVAGDPLVRVVAPLVVAADPEETGARLDILVARRGRGRRRPTRRRRRGRGRVRRWRRCDVSHRVVWCEVPVIRTAGPVGGLVMEAALRGRGRVPAVPDVSSITPEPKAWHPDLIGAR